MTVLAYILALALQVAGAVLLIIKYLGKTKERILEEYFPGSVMVERDVENVVRLEKNKIQECACKIYANRMAFVFIAIGYILSVFGEVPECKWRVAILIIITTAIIISLEKVIARKIAKVIYCDDLSIAYEEIEDRVDTIATYEEVMDILNMEDK